MISNKLGCEIGLYSHRFPWYVNCSAVSGVTLSKKCMYSSVWNFVIDSAEARLGRWV